MHKILILGGYGNFGKRIAELLTRQFIPVIIAGRNKEKADALVAALPAGLADTAVLDAKCDLARHLRGLKPAVTINTCGPFQGGDYSIAKACIAEGVHYIDLADARDFVAGIGSLDASAKAAGVAVITGASTVPALSSAVIEHFLPLFSEVGSAQFGIAPGQKAERGLATTQAILSYVGKRLKPCAGHPVRYGWQNTYLQRYPVIGRRWMANCDIPDLDLLPKTYGIKNIQFSAGMENSLVHLGLWMMSWLVRLGVPIHLPTHAKPLLKLSNWFDWFGSRDGGMHMILKGRDHLGAPLTKRWFIIGLEGDGPYIPAIPSIVLTKRMLKGYDNATGARACVELVSLHDYLSELSHLRIRTYEV